jgi:hypothetical protein
MKEDDFVGLDEFEEELISAQHYDFSLDIMSEFLDK